MRDVMRTHLSPEEPKPYRFLDPPFAFNSPNVSQYAPEITGFLLLETMRKRLGWASFAGKRILDFGCGVRFARTINNLELDVDGYVGIDVNHAAIEWLRRELASDPRFLFVHHDQRNAMYNPGGGLLPDDVLARAGVGLCDVACMFSVITHQNPAEAAATFRQLRFVTRDDGRLYFSAALAEALDRYTERTPTSPGLHSTYHPDVLAELVEANGWKLRRIFPKRPFQQPTFLCAAA